MTTAYDAYNQGANALAKSLGFDYTTRLASITENNPYRENDGWTLFKHSDNLDYDALEGRGAKLVNRDGVEVTLTMHRDTNSVQPASAPPAWDAPNCLVAAFFAAWRGHSGWKLYIQGDLPTKRVTADSLEPGDIADLRRENTGEEWVHAICVAPGKIAVAENHRAVVLSRHLETITVTTHLGQHPAYKEEA